MIELATVIAFLCVVAFMAAITSFQFHRACRKYKVTKRYDLWTVRDSKGRFVTITNNFWDICKLGV